MHAPRVFLNAAHTKLLGGAKFTKTHDRYTDTQCCLVPLHRSQRDAALLGDAVLLGDAQAFDGDLCLPRADEHCPSQVDVTRPHLLHQLPGWEWG